MTARELRDYLNNLPEELLDIEIKYDNGFDWEELSQIHPKYSPDITKMHRQLFLALS
jgi:hypothetical protein